MEKIKKIEKKKKILSEETTNPLKDYVFEYYKNAAHFSKSSGIPLPSLYPILSGKRGIGPYLARKILRATGGKISIAIMEEMNKKIEVK